MPARWGYDPIYAAVQSVPPGRVATYGQVAELAGLPRRWRLVGRALRALPDRSGVPWHRIVNAKGEISPREGDSPLLQRDLLADEGVVLDDRGRVDLACYRWDP